MIVSSAIYVLLIVWILFLQEAQCFRALSVLRRPSQSRCTLLGAKATLSSRTGDIKAIAREDFPILDQLVHTDKKLVYLDSAASSQKPNFVLDKMNEYYKTTHSNVHRGAHALAVHATDLFEASRSQVQQFINAEYREEIVFTKGATDAINLVAMSWGQRLRPGDEIILTVMEHHANLVPWQMLAQHTGAVLKFVQLTPSMEFDMDHFHSLLSPRTKMVAFAHVSNVLGCVNPAREITAAAHRVGAVVLLDACQSVPHMPVDVQALGADFVVASAHKMCGPTGIGFLYGKKALLESMPPVSGGGEMIDIVELTHSTYALPPCRFEAGTPPIAEAIGLGAACEYLSMIGMQRIHEHETQLGAYLYSQLAAINSLDLYGPPPTTTSSINPTTTSHKTDSTTTSIHSPRAGLVAFNSKTIHAADLAFFLDQEGIAVRTGHHCAQPLHRALKIPGSIRASLYFYNSQQDVDVFAEKLKETIEMFERIS